MPKASKAHGFYAVARGNKPGIYTTWPDAEQQVKGFKGAAYKKFKTEQEASTWMRQVQGGAPPALAAAKALSSPSSKSQPVASSSKAPHERCPRDPNVRQVFSDGACAHNGKRNATAGSGVFWGDSALDISEKLPGPAQTNQRSELYAILRVLESDPEPTKPLEILTDSAYSISCLQVWHHKWADNNWQNSSGKDVTNADLIKRILYLLQKRPASGKIRMTHVRGHQGIYGNEQADRLAVDAAKGSPVPERDYAGETEEEQMWDQLGDLPLDAWTSKLEFDIDESAVPNEEPPE